MQCKAIITWLSSLISVLTSPGTDALSPVESLFIAQIHCASSTTLTLHRLGSLKCPSCSSLRRQTSLKTGIQPHLLCTAFPDSPNQGTPLQCSCSSLFTPATHSSLCLYVALTLCVNTCDYVQSPSGMQPRASLLIIIIINYNNKFQLFIVGVVQKTYFI